jgi:hypothetical protein
MINNVVARFADGRLAKGTSLDVDPTKPLCHVKTADQGMVEVKLAELKALFFVKSLNGDSRRQDAERPDPKDPRLRGSTLVEVEFRDGERLVGLSNRYPPVGTYFFVLPVDPASNNVRILVNRAQARNVGKALM